MMRKDDEAVATALGAILVITIIFLALLVFQTSFVPQWEEDAEAEHAKHLQQQVVGVVGAMQNQAGPEAPSSTTWPINTIGRSGIVLANSANLAGTVSLAQDPLALNVSASELKLITSDQTERAVLDENWVDINGAHTVSDMESIKHLRIRVHDPEGGDQGDNVILEIIDADGQFAGRMTVHIKKFPSGYSVMTKVENPSGDVLVDDGESRFHQDAPALVWINALNPDLFFESLLKVAKTPLSLQMTENGLSADFTAQGIQANDGTEGPFGNSGTTISNYYDSHTGGPLSIKVPNQNYPATTYIAEHGAVIRQQSDGAAFLVDPAFSVTDAASTVRVDLSTVAGTGQTHGVSSRSTIQVTVGQGSSTSVEGTAPEVTILLKTSNPATWASFFDETLIDAGWDEVAGEYAITTTAEDVRLDLYGRQTDATHDVHLVWKHTSVPLTLQT